MARIPTATYRLQLHADFGFDQAAEIADYLYALGISHVYCSPYLQAAPGSQHGYDVVDHHKVNEELGGSDAHDRFCKHLGEVGLGQVLDIVPNHMAIAGRRNRLWWDVLENGPSSRYAPYFDINWKAPDESVRNKILVPILGDHYGRVLARHEITVERRGADFYTKYFDQELPVAPKSLAGVLMDAAAMTGSDYLAFLADSYTALPRASATDLASLAQRHRDKEVIRGLLDRLFHEVPFIADSVDGLLREMNRDLNSLDHFLDKQNFRLAFWRAAEQDLVYRRFFDVNTLVGLRMEDPHVFADTHALILRWLREGVLDGIRIDHPDGLLDPKQYFERLRQGAPDVWILAEKILEPGEQFRTEWPIDGTTGYDYLNEVSGLFVSSANEDELNRIYTEFTGQPTDYPAMCRDKKHRVLRDLLGSDVNRLTTLLVEICKAHRDKRDYTRHDVIRAIRELVACFPVYRTYVVPERNEIRGEDERYVHEAVEMAKANRPELETDLFDFMRDILLLKIGGHHEHEFVMRFQQFTGPAMAKGVEDTVFYNYNRLTSLNEVGGDPGRFGLSPDSFHTYAAGIQQTIPRTMLALSTHDTKRSEDVRARIHLLSEMPSEWEATLKRWSAMNAQAKQNDAPDPNTEYLIYQTLIGAWPIEEERLLAYVEKASREAKAQTNWLAPNQAFEDGVKAFISSIYKDRTFQEDLEKFTGKLVDPGRINSLSQVLLKLTCPGIPDTYQGCELWDMSLVDPDNRRPVDYQKRRALLKELPDLPAVEVMERSDEGLPKLLVTHRVSCLRRDHPEWFGPDADYQPLRLQGEKAEHAVSFQRGANVIVLVPRLVWTLDNQWGNTALTFPEGRWRNEFTGSVIEERNSQVADLLKDFPVALFWRT